MNKTSIIFILGLFCASFIFAQNSSEFKKEILKKKVENIAHINPIASADLKFLDSILIDKNIVFLGEASHFDGATLRAKSEIIKYLHKELGYEVLLLENGFFETRKAWLEIKTERDSSTGVFAFLTKTFGTHISENQKELFRYIGEVANSNSPLEIGGIDFFESSIYANTIKNDCEDLLKKIVVNYEYSEIRKYFENTFKPKRKNNKGKYSLDKFKLNCQVIIDTLVKVQTNGQGDDFKRSCLFMAKTLENKISSLEWENNRPSKRKKHGELLADYFTLRDVQMAENLLWYVEKFYPDKKIIVSASTYHISRNLDQITPRPYFLGKDAVPMGQFIWNKFKEQLYSIAFISHHGEIGSIKNPSDPLYLKIPQKKKKSLESILHSLGYQYGFLNLANDKELVKVLDGICLTPAYIKPIKTDWSKVYDGLFFIDEMYTDDWYYLEGRSGIKQPY